MPPLLVSCDSCHTGTVPHCTASTDPALHFQLRLSVCDPPFARPPSQQPFSTMPTVTACTSLLVVLLLSIAVSLGLPTDLPMRPPTPSDPFHPGVVTPTAIEAFLLNRSSSFYRLLKTLNATEAMTRLAPFSTAQTGVSGLNDGALGGIDPTSAESVQRRGAAQVLQLALYRGQTLFMSAAIRMVKEDIAIRIMQFRLWAVTNASLDDGGPDGDVKQRQERGDIAWEAWLLHQAGAFFSAPPGHGPINSTQQLIEAFTTDYVELLCNRTTWPTTGYNKEVAQGLHPAAVMGIYGEQAFQTLWPRSYEGFFSFWDAMLFGEHGTYEPDNSIGYTSFNVGMVLSMGLWLQRVQFTSSSPDHAHAYISDSLDMFRVLHGLAAVMMPNGNAVNFNRGMIHWTTEPGHGSTLYAYNGFGSGAPFCLYMGHILYNSPLFLYTARKIERFLITTGQVSPSLLGPTEVFPSNIQQFDTLGVPPPPIVSQLTYQRVSPNCYSGLLLCRGAPQANSILIPNKMVLRAGSEAGSDYSPFVLLSLSGGGEHANSDQRMTLENTVYNASYITARAGTTIGNPYGVSQVNLCNCVLIAPSQLTNESRSYPLVGDVTTFYSDVQLNPSANNYVLQSAEVQQLSGGSAYGSMLFSQYEFPGVRVGRQVVLTPEGVIVVIDSVYNEGVASVSSFSSGVTYRLWPNVSASGSNWALQSPFFAVNSSSFLPPTTNTSTLFWIQSTPGRVVGLQREPLTDFGFGSAGQTASTLYAYDTLEANTSSVLISVLYPLPEPGRAAEVAAQIAVSVNSTTGDTSVSVPGLSAVVLVPYLSPTPAAHELLLRLSAQSLSNSTWGRPLSSWPDSSGANHSFIPLNQSALAVVNATAMNGRPAVLFDSGQALVGPAIFPTYTDYTVITLLLFPSASANRQSVLGSLNGSQHALSCIVGSSSGHITAIHNTVILNSATLPQVRIRVPLLLTLTWQQTLGLAQLYLNGTLVANASASPPSPTVVVSDPTLVLGWFNEPSQGFGYLSAYVSELMLFNYALDNEQRTAAEQSLRISYDIPGAS